ncbi:MAG: HDOD domain-containing protein [Pseudomonadales bacterium]|jgi:HD-like signal output (HDOD) protein|nr:HDOD domain-containing protein [Pseudomonadales bacterium]MBP9032333.1 HDOD domain-containing protein [Pseudomonadales bacterium]
MEQVIEEVREELIDAIRSNRLVLPTLPEVALKVRDAAEDPRTDSSGIARVIANDAALSARIIRVANSPLLRAASPILDLRMAISRLGMQYTCNLSIGLAMEQMFQATSDAVDRRMREVWARSTEVAGISAVLAKTYTRLKPDQATLAGLVHQIGALPILRFAEEQRRLLKTPEVLDQLITGLHGEIGQLILETWDFPPELAIVPTQYLQFDRQPAAADYADVVMVAHLQSRIGSDDPVARMDWHGISAFTRLGLEPDFNAMEVEDLGETLAASIASLQ